jgi:hypothetical protein
MLLGGLESPDLIELVDQHGAHGSDALVIAVQPKEADPVRNRQNQDPSSHIRRLRSTWEKSHQDVVEGPAGWLPNEVWAPLKRRVHRVEAAIRQAGPAATAAPRVYWDYYIVQFSTNNSIIVTAMTERNDHVVFRDQAESVIKSFNFGPSTDQPAAPSAARPAPPGRAQ